jgi:hypothetical protein
MRGIADRARNDPGHMTVDAELNLPLFPLTRKMLLRFYAKE